MKNLSTIIAFLLVFPAFSQTWIREGARWHSGAEGGGGDRTLYITEYTGDSVVLGKSCQVLKITFHLWHLQYPPPSQVYSYQGSSVGYEYTYANDDTVFWFVNAAWHILYDFSAQPGDSWDCGIPPYDTACGPTILEVQSAGTTVINGETLRWISIIPHENAGTSFSGRVNERFGLFDPYIKDHGNFPLPNFCGGTMDYYLHSFICYEDNAFPTYNASGYPDCGRIMTLGAGPENAPDPLNFYVDQQNEILYYKVNSGAENTVLRIADMQGRTVRTISTGISAGAWQSFPVPNLSPGVYILQAVSNTYITGRRFLLTGQ